MWLVSVAAALALECPATMTSPEAITSPAAPSLSMKVAQALHPESTIRSFSRTAAVDSLKNYLANDAEVAKLEKSLPGFKAGMLERAPEAVERLLDKQIPVLQRCMAEKLAKSVSIADLQDTLKFAMSPAGKKVLQDITEDNIRLYLRKGPLTKADVEQIKAQPATSTPATAGRSAKALYPVLLKWAEYEFEAENKLMGEVAEEVVTAMAASVTKS